MDVKQLSQRPTARKRAKSQLERTIHCLPVFSRRLGNRARRRGGPVARPPQEGINPEQDLVLGDGLAAMRRPVYAKEPRQ